jgi:hypothetical protein
MSLVLISHSDPVREICFKENERIEGSYAQQFIYQTPRRNFEAVVEMQDRFNDIFRKHDVTNRQVFLAGQVENVPGFTDVSDNVQASPE